MIIALTLLSSCTNQISADKFDNNLSRPTPTTANLDSVNGNRFKSYENEADKIDKKQREELEIRSQKFEEVPEEFKNVDFENFKFPAAKLKNGEFEDIDEKHLGGTRYNLSLIYFLDLSGDSKKEAIVFLSAVNCGGSCDGGRYFIHFYSSQNGKPKLLDVLETGSLGGCNLKSFAVKNKKISITQFGNCKSNFKHGENREFFCKFCVKDLTNSVYTFNDKSELMREFVEVIEAPETNVMNYQMEVDINE